MLDDRALLLTYARSRDAEAFALLVKRYSALVFSVAKRVTGNTATAEDVTQDCFFALARHSASIRGSLANWLHRVALNKSLQSIRSETRRRRYENRDSLSSDADDEQTWKQMAPLIDAALAKLPEELREPLVQHFLLGRPQTQVAENLHISQSTVCRRLQEGIERLRENLRQTGVTCGAAVVSAGLAKNANAAVPARLSVALAKIALAGPGAVSAGVSTATVASHGVLKSSLIKGAFITMALQNAKAAIVIGVGALVAATTVGIAYTKQHSSQLDGGAGKQLSTAMSRAEIDAIIRPLPAKLAGMTSRDWRFTGKMRVIYASLPDKARKQVNTKREYVFHLSDLPEEHADVVRDLVENDKGNLYPTLSNWLGGKPGEPVDFSKIALLFQKQGKYVALRFRYNGNETNWCPFGLWTGR